MGQNRLNCGSYKMSKMTYIMSRCGRCGRCGVSWHPKHF